MKCLMATPVLALFLGIPGSAQSAADLLQKGIYAQETAGDLDSAVQIFRQVAGAPSGDKKIAAQAQYQIVLCMLQRGDRPAASRELETLARNFPDQPDLVAKARKLLPGASAILPAPWGESETSQLDIRRDGTDTGETLYYVVDPAHNNDNAFQPVVPNQDSLRWQLTTPKSYRGVSVRADRTTGQPTDQPTLFSNDVLGDPAVEPLAGPAIDVQLSVFAMRRLPLAVGYKTTLTTLPLSLSHLAPREVELAVTGIEPVEVTAGKFKCYKVVFAALSQTFWFGVEASRPLVKFQAGNTEAQLVKIWGAEDFIETELAFFKDAGWKFGTSHGQGPEVSGDVHNAFHGPQGLGLSIRARKVYTAPAGIAKALDEDFKANDCDPETVRTRTIGGQPALSCVNKGRGWYYIWIRSGNAAIHLQGSDSPIGVFVWQIDRILATAKRIP